MMGLGKLLYGMFMILGAAKHVCLGAFGSVLRFALKRAIDCFTNMRDSDCSFGQWDRSAK